MSTVTLPDSLDSDTLFVKADVEWLVCKKSCIPGNTSVTLPLDIGAVAPSVHASLFEKVREQHPSHPLDVKESAVESVTSVDTIVPDSTFTHAIKITPTSDKPLVFDTEKDWPLFTPINGDWWWINEQRLSKTNDGGLLIQARLRIFRSRKVT